MSQDENDVSSALGGLLPEGLAKPAVIAIGALLLKHMLDGRKAPEAAAPEPQSLPGSGGGLGGLLTGGGLIGGLGGLIDSFRNSGQGQAVDSWIGKGQNQTLQPEQVGSAIGQQTLSEIAAKAGLSEQELLQALAHALPQVVDRATPQGQLPSALPGGFGRI